MSTASMLRPRPAQKGKAMGSLVDVLPWSGNNVLVFTSSGGAQLCSFAGTSRAMNNEFQLSIPPYISSFR